MAFSSSTARASAGLLPFALGVRSALSGLVEATSLFDFGLLLCSARSLAALYSEV